MSETIRTGAGRRSEPGRRGEAGRLLAAIRALVRRFSISERADVSCCGITVAQAAALEALASVGPLSLGSLSRRLGISASTLTRNLARLEERRLVARAADPEDARSFRAFLTGEGRRAAARLRRQEEGFAASLLGRLPAGRRTEILSSLHDLLAAVRVATESCCPGAFDHLMTDFPRAAAPAPNRRLR